MTAGTTTSETKPTILLAGATGALGGQIAQCLLQRGANVKALVRSDSSTHAVTELQRRGVGAVVVDFASTASLVDACTGGACLVSALSGLRPVIVDVQSKLMHAAVEAGVPRFIPSDFAIDFTKLPHGNNRNLDMRQEFHEKINKAPIAATSVLNGMFTDLLTGQAPVILYPLNRVVYWGDPDQPLDFTTMHNTAEYTAAAALDPDTPRHLRIAGDVQSARGLANAASEATGKSFKLFRVGGIGTLNTMIKVTRKLMPADDEVFPPWQGMQYLRDMFTGIPKLQPLDNERYSGINWTSVKDVIASK